MRKAIRTWLLGGDPSEAAALLTGRLAMLPVFVCLVLLLGPGRAAGQIRLADSNESNAPSALVIGFVGGFVHSDDLRHSEVRIARQIQAAQGDHVHVLMFQNRQRSKAHVLVLRWLSVKRDGQITRGERRNIPIILFGHSWGASAVVSLARDLQRDGIPVSLTIQVDSIAKHGENDSVIPSNVAEAVNFFQTGGILHGRSKITASDASRTRILGNFRQSYEKEPSACRAYPWYDRLLFKGHTAIECDPRVWSQVEALIRTQLAVLTRPAHTQVASHIGE